METKICKFCKKEFRKVNKFYCCYDCKRKAMIGKIGYWRGKTRTYKNPKERAEKISQTMKGKRPYWLGYQKKENHPSWIDGRSDTKEYKSYHNRRRKIARKGLNNHFSFKEWEDMKKQYNYTCPSCYKKEPEIKLTVDHIIPLSLSGKNNKNNIQPLCFSCNCKKYKSIKKYEYATI